MSTMTKSGTRHNDLGKQIAQGFAREIPKYRLSPLYQLAMLLVALLVVTLPLIYLGIVVLVGWGVYHHAVHHVSWLHVGQGMGLRVSGRGYLFLLFIYAAPIVAGVILLMFMVKPFLAPRVERHVGPTLTAQDEPLLFDLVARLCRKLGAPFPRRIEITCDVNASASFRRGWLSFLSRDLVLTIGMPLAAGLSVAQFAGVIAHEFGHFRQSVTMRLDFTIRSVNHWFARVVYQRDGWDETLEEWTESEIGYIIIFAVVMRGLIWLTRRVLWLLMWVSHMLTCWLSREMEYDADRAQALIAGSAVTKTTLPALGILNAVMGNVLNQMSDELPQGKLYDNLPEYIATSSRLVTADHRNAFARKMLEAKTGWFDTHPAAADRAAAVDRMNAPGLIDVEAPASAVFANFTRLCKAVTYAFYRAHLGPELERYELVPTETRIAAVAMRSQSVERTDRFLGYAYRAFRLPLLTIASIDPPANPKQALEQLRQSRLDFASRIEHWRAELDALEESYDTLVLASVVLYLEKTGVRVEPEQFPPTMPSFAVAGQKRTQAQHRIRAANTALKQYDELIQQRVQLALNILTLPAIAQRLPSAEADLRRARQWLPRLAELSKRFAEAKAISVRTNMYEMWSGVERSFEYRAAIRATTRTLSEQLMRDLARLEEATKSLRGQTDAPEPPPDVEQEDDGQYAMDTGSLKHVPDRHNDLTVDARVLGELSQLHSDAINDLLSIADEVETLLKLPPLVPKPA